VGVLMSTNPQPPANAVPSPRRSRVRRWGVPIIVLVLVGVPIWWGIDEVLARGAYQRGQTSLLAGDYSTARKEFARCLKSWPHRAEVWFAAGRAARLQGDFKSADQYLMDAAALGELPERIVVEKSLMSVKRGEPFAAHERAFRIVLTHSSPSTSESLAVLASSYIGQFRLHDAESLTAVWCERWPDDAAAWQYRTNVLERLNRRELSRNASAEWVRLAPNDLAARLTHVRLMLENRASGADIALHLEWLRSAAMNDAEALQYRAKALEAEGNLEEAVGLLDRAIASSRTPVTPLTERARLELDRGRPQDAIRFARQAVAADASDLDAAFTLMRSFQQVGNTSEAANVEVKWKQLRADLDAAQAIGAKMLAQPYNADLRREMGELLIKNGRMDDGLRWLESALAITPDHAATHQYLANFYAKRGQRALSDQHRIKGSR
jgi:tetratricopeptide (TPR) repeat protein